MTEPVDLRKMAENLLALSAFKSLVAAEYDRRHEALQAQYRALGIRGQEIEMPDGTMFGSVSVTRPGRKAAVSDMDACLEWVEEKHPTEVTQVFMVRPAYLKKLLDLAAKEGIGVDPETGEVLPWISVAEPEPQMRATASREAKDMIRQVVNDGQIPFQLES